MSFAKSFDISGQSESAPKITASTASTDSELVSEHSESTVIPVIPERTDVITAAQVVSEYLTESMASKLASALDMTLSDITQVCLIGM